MANSSQLCLDTFISQLVYLGNDQAEHWCAGLCITHRFNQDLVSSYEVPDPVYSTQDATFSEFDEAYEDCVPFSHTLCQLKCNYSCCDYAKRQFKFLLAPARMGIQAQMI